MVSILGDWKFTFPEPIELKRVMKDYLEDVVDEKYYINNEKAQKLIQKLIDNGTLQNTIPTDGQTDRRTDGQTDRRTVDGTVNKPKARAIGNCIKARYDAGISNLRSDGNCVVESNRLVT